jgi:hypothetical protein
MYVYTYVNMYTYTRSISALCPVGPHSEPASRFQAAPPVSARCSFLFKFFLDLSMVDRRLVHDDVRKISIFPSPSAPPPVRGAGFAAAAAPLSTVGHGGSVTRDAGQTRESEPLPGPGPGPYRVGVTVQVAP